MEDVVRIDHHKLPKNRRNLELARLRAQGDRSHWHVATTAHPSKFERVVEPLVGHLVPVPPALEALLDRPSHAKAMSADYAALRDELASSSVQA